MSEVQEGAELEQAPKTPEQAAKISKDDSFKTCKSTMPTPRTRRQLRMTPARVSIQKGESIFKEINNSAKKFNTRSRKSNSAHKLQQRNNNNDTAGSNETFIRYEQDLLFERDSLDNRDKAPSFEPPSPITLKSISPKTSSPVQTPKRTKSPPKRIKSPPKSINKLPGPKTFRPPVPKTFRIPEAKSTTLKPSRFVTPQVNFRKPPTSLKSTASKYMDSSKWNTSRLSRSSSYKSTAEIEREYMRSLRSFY